jgi:signal transduction histidine kinase/ActR/RegA family two-component response regulator
VTSATIHRLRAEALHSLVTRVSGSTAGGILADALDHLFGPTSARSGVALLASPKLEVVADHGLTGVVAGDDLREAVSIIATRAVDERKSIRLADVRAHRAGIEKAGAIAAVGCTAALAVPLIHRRRALGVFVLLFPPQHELDEETTLFVETVASLIVPSLVGQNDPPSSILNDIPSPKAVEGQALGGATLLGASVGHELEGPVGALALQLDEQRRIVQDLQIFSEGGDTPLGGSIAELAELTEELSATITRLRETTDQLTRLGQREIAPAAIDLSEVARMACSVARPGFEERGILLEMQLAEGSYVSGHKESLLQVLSDLLVLARDRAELGPHPPKVVVRTSNEGNRMVLAVDDLGPVPDGKLLRDFERRPFADASADERRRLVLKLLGDVVLAHGGHVELVSLEPNGTRYRIILPSFGAIESNHAGAFAPAQGNATEGNVIRKVLVVDDDPVFSRAARRAMKPHQVREANTASEAEIILSDSNYLPDLVICDLMLPGADGTALHRKIFEKRTEVASRFLFVTGGTLGKDAADYIRSSGCGALRKPIDLSAVRRHLSTPNRDTVTTTIVRTLRQELETS